MNSWDGPQIIQGLPEHLKHVPPGPTGPNDPEAEAKKQAWIDWGFALREYRLQTAAAVKANPKLEAIEWRKCALDPAYFITVYGWLYEPRKGKGRGGYNPWIPFERQVQMIRWWQALMAADDEKADGVISKPRDVGMSWLMVGLFLWAWLFEETFGGLFVSMNESLVDGRNPKALFWKFDKLLQFLPHYLKPAGYEEGKHRVKLFAQNPENGNTLAGAATTSNAARSDRVTAAFFDEAAQIKNFMDTWMSAADSTEHRIAGSTEHLQHGTDFIDLRTGTNSEYTPSVFIIEWYQHPLHDRAWYKWQEKRMAADPDAFQREVLRNPYTDSQFIYPTSREKYPTPGLFWIPGNPLYVGIDPGLDDNCALVYVQFNVASGEYEVLNGYTARKMIADFYIPFLTGSFEYRDPKTGEEIDLRTVYRYTDYEVEVIEWAESVDVKNAKFIGDLYGQGTQGASADTWYSTWAKADVLVNRDRLPSGKQFAARMQARSLTGRRKAVRWLLPKLVFADTVGARQALLALQNNIYDVSATTDRIPERGMKRDGTTHYTSAIEYFAANIYLQSELLAWDKRREQEYEEMERDLPTLGGQSRLARMSQLREVS